MYFEKAISRFLSCQRGVTAIMFALVLVPILLTVGGAVDYSNVIRVREELQGHLDSAVMAAAANKELETDDEKIAYARNHFESVLTPELAAVVKDLSFSVNEETGVAGAAYADVPTQVLNFAGYETFALSIVAEANIEDKLNRQLDMVFCIDATGSMQPTIDGVTNAAFELESKINARLKELEKEEFDGTRVRVIFYRDFSADLGSPDTFAPPPPPQDPADPKFTPAEEVPPINRSNGGKFWEFPDDRGQFRNFLDSENANGGGDYPESGFTCLNEALESEWAKPKDRLAGTRPSEKKKINSVTPMIVIWTDTNAREIVDQKVDSYALAMSGHLPSTYDKLKEKWDDPELIDQKNKLLVFFGDLDNAKPTKEECESAEDPYDCKGRGTARWRESIGSWGIGKYVYDYPLVAGGDDLADRLVDVLSKSKASTPRITR